MFEILEERYDPTTGNYYYRIVERLYHSEHADLLVATYKHYIKIHRNIQYEIISRDIRFDESYEIRD